MRTETTIEYPTDASGFRHYVAAIADFMESNAWRVDTTVRFRHEWILESVVFHLVRGSLRTATNKDGEIIGVAIAWQENEDSLRERTEEDVFQWQDSDPQGDSVYWALVLTTEPGLMPELTRKMVDTHPEWPKLKFMAHRRGRLVRRDGMINRVLALANRQVCPTEN